MGDRFRPEYRTHRHRSRLSLAPEANPGTRVNADNANANAATNYLLWCTSAKHRPAVRPSWDESPKRRADRHDPDDAPEANGLGPLGNGPPVRDRTGLPKETPVRRHPGCRGGVAPEAAAIQAPAAHARTSRCCANDCEKRGPGDDHHALARARRDRPPFRECDRERARCDRGLERSDKGSTAGGRRSEHADELYPARHTRGCGFPTQPATSAEQSCPTAPVAVRKPQQGSTACEDNGASAPEPVPNEPERVCGRDAARCSLSLVLTIPNEWADLEMPKRGGAIRQNE